MGVQKYHKSEQRDIRPFFGAAALGRALDGAQIRIYEDQPFTEAVAFVIEEQDIPRLSVAVRPNLSEALLKASSIPREELALAITAINPFLKKALLVTKVALVKPAPEEVAIGAEVLEKLGNGSTMTVEVALCLARELPKKPGSPFLQGHWLAKKAFDLRPPKLAEDFDVEPMDDAGWKKMGFPEKTLYFVEYYGGINEPVSKERGMAKVLVHAEVFKKLSLESNQRTAKPLMGMLAAEIPAQILAASKSDWESDEAAEPGSPLEAFLKRINRVYRCDLDELRKLVSEPGMPRLRAILQADQQTVRQIVEA